jgi:peptidoglycan/LPS O-acetylase OafA/YrhL
MYLNHLVWPHIGFDLVSWSALHFGHTSVALAIATVLATVVSALVALVSYLLIELPFLRWRDRLLFGTMPVAQT